MSGSASAPAASLKRTLKLRDLAVSLEAQGHLVTTILAGVSRVSCLNAGVLAMMSS
jgi:hypothetical protein